MRQSIRHSMRMSRGNSVYRGGSSLVTGNNSTMAAAGGWNGANLGTFNINSTVAGKLYMLGNGGSDTTFLGPVTTAGSRYKISLKARLNAGASTTIKVGADTTTTSSSFNITPTSTEKTFIGYIKAIDTPIVIGLSAGQGGLNGIAFEIDDVQVFKLGAVA